MMTQFNVFSAWLKAHAKSDRGATMVEYALLVALIGIVLIVAWQFLAGAIDDTASKAGSALDSANS